MDRKQIIRKVKIALALLLVTAVLLPSRKEEGAEEKEGALEKLLQRAAMELYLPGAAACQRQDLGKEAGESWSRLLLWPYPVFSGMLRQERKWETTYAESDYGQLLLLEGADEEQKSISQEELAYDENAIHLESTLEEALKQENGQYQENKQESKREGEAEGEEKEQAAEPEEEREKGQQEEGAEGFVPVQERVYQYPWESLKDRGELIRAFYAVDATTVADSQYINLDSLLSKDMRLQEEEGDAPQILIYHTHSLESFADSTPGDTMTTIVGAGEYLSELLRERYGYRVLHHTGCYDEERDYAYSKSLPAIEELLAQNPSIQVVIDLHRDEMPEDKRLVIELQGKRMAQFMFFNGMSQTTKGKIDYLENPYLSENLAFSFQMQTAVNEYYPGIARRIYLKAYRYNMHLCPKSLLIELGAQNNTMEEIWNACEPLAHVLHLVLSGEEPVR